MANWYISPALFIKYICFGIHSRLLRLPILIYFPFLRKYFTQKARIQLWVAIHDDSHFAAPLKWLALARVNFENFLQKCKWQLWLDELSRTCTSLNVKVRRSMLLKNTTREYLTCWVNEFVRIRGLLSSAVVCRGYYRPVCIVYLLMMAWSTKSSKHRFPHECTKCNESKWQKDHGMRTLNSTSMASDDGNIWRFVH